MIANGNRRKAIGTISDNLPRLYETAIHVSSSSLNGASHSLPLKIIHKGASCAGFVLLLVQRFTSFFQSSEDLALLADLSLIRAEMHIGDVEFDHAKQEARCAIIRLALDNPLLLLYHYLFRKHNSILRKIELFQRVIVRAGNCKNLYRNNYFISRSQDNTRANFDCDVIAIASDEAPYITDFVHHYKYLGFKHIFIGVNNSLDETMAMLNMMSSQSGSIHAISTDDVHSQFGQKSSYTKLYLEAQRISGSKYVLFVDIDEFWVAKPFPLSISDYLRNLPDFDSVGFHWINLYETKEFTPPLSCFSEAFLKAHFKSLVAYTPNILELRCHAPLLQSSTLHYKAIDAKGSLIIPIDLPIGIEIPKAAPLNRAILDEETAFIFHRPNRSMIEYSYRMLKPHANQRKEHERIVSEYPFKENRRGFDYRSGIRVDPALIERILPSTAVEEYVSSLEQFITEYRLNAYRSASILQINKDAILQRLRSIPVNILHKYRDTWSKGYKGTEFYDLLNQLASTNNPHRRNLLNILKSSLMKIVR